MKIAKLCSAVICAIALLASPALAGEKTCCQKADADGKVCPHKCCVAAHKDGKSCLRCNPGKEDLKLKKQEQKGDKKTSKATDKSAQ